MTVLLRSTPPEANLDCRRRKYTCDPNQHNETSLDDQTTGACLGWRSRGDIALGRCVF